MRMNTDHKMKKLIEGAVKRFWESRATSMQKNASRGTKERGTRGAVLAGGNMDGFADLLETLIKRLGNKHVHVYSRKTNCRLPGYFRATKSWDFLVFYDKVLLAAIEFKSQVGSFGNNCNNRIEESIGAAQDFLTAGSEGLFGEHSSPFRGWLILVEDCENSRVPVKMQDTHFPVDGAYLGKSYQERYGIYCARAVSRRLYDAAGLIVAKRGESSFRTLGKHIGPEHFFFKLLAHLKVEVDSLSSSP